MRLLVVTQYFWPENFRINDLVGELVRRGHQVTVLTGLPNYPDGEIFPKFQENPALFSEYEGASIIRVPMTARGKGSLQLMLNYLTFALSASIMGTWKLRGNSFDAIFVYEPSPITVGLPAAFLRKVKNAPVAFWVLDLWPETLQAIGVVRSKPLLQAVGKLVSFIYKRCDLILAQSKSFIPQIRKYTGKNGRIEYFPSWSESVFEAENTTKTDLIPNKPDSFNIMFAGNIGDAQDFPAILAAAENLRSEKTIRWLIVGDGRIAEWVKVEIQKRNLTDCVLMLGRHPVENMPSFFKHADALLVSLKNEPIFSMTIPGKLQSYLAAGIPVVAMLDGEGAEVVERACAGLTCAAGDHEGLAKAVLKLSKISKEEREVMGNNGLTASKKEFDREKLISQLEFWLDNIKRNKMPESKIEETA